MLRLRDYWLWLIMLSVFSVFIIYLLVKLTANNVTKQIDASCKSAYNWLQGRASFICPLEWKLFNGAPPCRTSLWGNDLCIHWQPRSWHYPISCLLTVEGKAAQQALHCHSHTEASVPPQLQHGRTTVCRAAQRLCRKGCSDLCPSLAAENQTFHTLDPPRLAGLV